MSVYDKIHANRRAEVYETCEVIRKVLKLYGKTFKMADFGGTGNHSKMLRESGLFEVTKSGSRGTKRQFEYRFICDEKSAPALLEDYLENTYAARVYESQIRIQQNRNARQNKAEREEKENEESDDTPVIEKTETGAIYHMSKAKHWTRSEGKGHIHHVSSLGANSFEYHD